MTFREWWKQWEREEPGITSKINKGYAEFVWDASRANMVESEPEEPTPTEMVKRLLEKGWEIHETDEYRLALWHPIKDKIIRASVDGVRSAYYQTFPPKKRIEVEVWTSNGWRNHNDTPVHETLT